MQIITLILAAVAMVAALAALILVILERKRSRSLISAVDQRFRGMARANKESQNNILRCAEEGNKKAIAAAEELAKVINGRIDKANQAIRIVKAKAEAVEKKAQENKGRIDDLEHGVVPDFETAQKAVNAVNDINKGIAGILGFDPLEALKQSRQEGD